MKTSLHTLVEPAKVRGKMIYLGQNILLPLTDDNRLRFAAVIYAARGSDSDASAVALLIKLTFAKPMMPLLSPGHRLWDQLVKPHLHRLQSTLLKCEASGQAQSLGAVTTHIASLVRHEPRVLNEGGALLLPQAPSPQAVVPERLLQHERLPLACIEDQNEMPPARKLTAWPIRLFFDRAA